MLDKIKNWLIIILIALVGYYYVINAINGAKLNKLSEQLNKKDVEIERLKANVETGKQKAELEKKMDSSKDVDNLNHVPDTDVLMQLRSDPL
jgi:outer membrane murein-binding lipoprotein Lpp